MEWEEHARAEKSKAVNESSASPFADDLENMMPSNSGVNVVRKSK